jgi:hypothetical protein
MGLFLPVEAMSTLQTEFAGVRGEEGDGSDMILDVTI